MFGMGTGVTSLLSSPNLSDLSSVRLHLYTPLGIYLFVLKTLEEISEVLTYSLFFSIHIFSFGLASQLLPLSLEVKPSTY